MQESLEQKISALAEKVKRGGRAFFIVVASDDNDNPLYIVTNDHKNGAKILNLPLQDDGAAAAKGTTLSSAVEAFERKCYGQG